MYYKVYENGLVKEWIFLFHGIGGSSTVWYRQLKNLRRKFNVVMVDLPSHGKSGVIKKEYGSDYLLENCISDVKDLIDSVSKKYGIKNYHLMGVSLGTIIIHEILKSRSKDIKSVILVGAVIKFNRLGKFLISVANRFSGFIKLKHLYYIMANILLPGKRNKTSRKLFIKEAKKVKESEFRKWFNMIDKVEQVYDENVYNNGVKKLYVSGELDHIFIDGVKENVRKDKDSSLRIIKNAGHVCNVEEWFEFNQILNDCY